ncbi:MAG: class D sortase [Capsulimonadales bacterium]|nr:class D sortase [Capsulimonadales bacterium]
MGRSTIRARRLLANLLITAGLLLALWPAAIEFFGTAEQNRLRQEFDRVDRTTTPSDNQEPMILPVEPLPPLTTAKEVEPQGRPPERTRPVRFRRVAKGALFARLRIPRIGLEAMVIEGTDQDDLRRGPGHIPGTGFPGEPGNCAIAAHRARWFKNLPNLRKGDAVWVDQPDRTYKYIVTGRKTVTPDRGDLLNRNVGSELTLITCDEPTANAPYRILIFCRLASTFAR